MINEEEYLKTRVKSQQNYFSDKASHNKKYYYLTSISKLGISLIITLLSSVMLDTSVVSIFISVLSALVAFVEGLLLLYKYNENWIIYRMTSENIKKEEHLFKTKSGEYYMLDDSQAYNMFVQNVETLIENSNKNWQEIYNNK